MTANPNSEIVNIVQTYLSDDKIRPLTDLVKVLSPTKKKSIDATIYLYRDVDITSVQTTINAKLNEYKISLSEKLGKNVIQTQIIAILNSIYGVFKVDLKTSADIEISESEWANLVNFNIAIGGYADE